MKRLIFLFAAALVACDKGPYGDGRNGKFDVPTLTAENTIRFLASGPVELILQGGKIAVDWGDGTITKDIAPQEGRTIFTHEYGDASAEHLVRIWTEELGNFQVGNVRAKGISIGRCPVLSGFSLYGLSGTESLNLDSCPALEWLTVSEWPDLRRIATDGCPRLRYVSVMGNPLLDEFDLSRNTAITWLNLVGNALTELHIPAGLTSLDVSGNPLTEVDLSGFSDLEFLSCTDIPGLERFDITGCERLVSVNFSGTAIGSALDFSANHNLTGLIVRGSGVMALDLSENRLLRIVSIENNQLTAEALNRIFTDLPVSIATRAGAETHPTETRLSPPPVPQHCRISFAGNPGADACDTSILLDKSWVIE